MGIHSDQEAILCESKWYEVQRFLFFLFYKAGGNVKTESFASQSNKRQMKSIWETRRQQENVGNRKQMKILG